MEAAKMRQKDEEFLETSITGWRGAISFRNILAHGYDHIEDDIVWGIIESDLTQLIESIQKNLN